MQTSNRLSLQALLQLNQLITNQPTTRGIRHVH